jgi:hypothetical protein
VDNSAFNEVFNKELSANGTNFIKERMEFTEKVPTLVNVDLLYSPDQVIISEEPYGKTYPPMPLKSPGLRLYALPSKLKITDSNGDSKKVFDFLPNESVSISLLGCPGASSYIYINGELAGNIAEPFETGVWSMGQGFLERNWAGNIKVSILTAPP